MEGKEINTVMAQFVRTFELPPGAIIFEEEDRLQTGKYELDPGVLNIFKFEILPDGQLRVPVRHLNTNDRTHQTWSIRAWISTDPNGIELFYRFHPNTGGLSHLFYDENITPIPEPKKHAPMRNEFSAITYTPQDELVPLAPGIYYYNIINMVLKTNAYEIAFIDPTVC